MTSEQEPKKFEGQRDTEVKFRVNHLGVVEKVKVNDKLVKEQTKEDKLEAQRILRVAEENKRKSNEEKGLTKDGKIPIKRTFSEHEGAPLKDGETPKGSKYEPPKDNKGKPKKDEQEQYKQAIYFLIILMVFFAISKATNSVNINTDAFDSSQSGTTGAVQGVLTVAGKIIKGIGLILWNIISTVIVSIWKIITTLLGLLS